MPLWLLATIVPVGLAIIIGAVHLTGGTRQGRLSEADAAAAWREAFPDRDRFDVLVSDDRRTALVIASDEATGIVHEMGAHHIARSLGEGVLRGIASKDDHVILELRDWTLPKVSLRFSDPIVRSRAESALAALLEEERRHA